MTSITGRFIQKNNDLEGKGVGLDFGARGGQRDQIRSPAIHYRPVPLLLGPSRRPSVVAPEEARVQLINVDGDADIVDV
jgi:hypothetical protein